MAKTIKEGRKRCPKVDDLTPQEARQKRSSAGHRVPDSMIIEALRRTNGLVSYAAKLLTESGTPISRQAISERLKTNPKLRGLMDDIEETNVDKAVAALFKQMHVNGNVTAIIFYLKTHAAHRGYIEKQHHELSGPNGGPIETKETIDFDSLTDAQLDALIANSEG